MSGDTVTGAGGGNIFSMCRLVCRENMSTMCCWGAGCMGLSAFALGVIHAYPIFVYGGLIVTFFAIGCAFVLGPGGRLPETPTAAIDMVIIPRMSNFTLFSPPPSPPSSESSGVSTSDQPLQLDSASRV